MAWDQIGFDVIHAMTGNPLVDPVMLFLAEYLVLLVPLSLMVLWFRGDEAKIDALFVFVTAVLGILLSYLAGLLYAHENPSAVYETLVAHEPENAFPSQHTVAMLATAFGFLWRERDQYGYLLLGTGLVTGFARVYIGEHWPIDILGSVIVAGLAVVIIAWQGDRLHPLMERVADLGTRIEDTVKQSIRG